VHGMGVAHLLAALSSLPGSASPEIVLFGAEVCVLDPFTDTLSPRLTAALDEVISRVFAECTS
jgi:hypothetical protein